MANIYKVIRVAVGAFLLASAGLKTHGLATDPLAQESVLVTSRILIATIEVEIVLGLWLLGGWAARASRIAAIAFFTMLAAASLYMAVEGQASCGCLGRVRVSPWWAFALDTAVIAALVVWRPAKPREPLLATWMQGILVLAFGSAMILVLAGAIFMILADNPMETLGLLRGESITATPGVSDVGDGVLGETREFQIQLRNNTDRTIRVVGGTATCACLTTADLPIELLAHQARRLPITVRFKGSVGAFQQPFVLFTDDDAHRTITASVRGYVVTSPEG